MLGWSLPKAAGGRWPLPQSSLPAGEDVAGDSRAVPGHWAWEGQEGTVMLLFPFVIGTHRIVQEEPPFSRKYLKSNLDGDCLADSITDGSSSPTKDSSQYNTSTDVLSAALRNQCTPSMKAEPPAGHAHPPILTVDCHSLPGYPVTSFPQILPFLA
jgi:hypothetical protein